MHTPVKAEVQQALRDEVAEVVARITAKAAGRTCGTCWRFNGCAQESVAPEVVACAEHQQSMPARK